MNDSTLRVLLLDDEASLREPLAAYLRYQHGYTVDVVGTGDEALERLRSTGGGYDVTLVDEVLTGQLSGFDTLCEIKTYYPDIEVIVFTGWGMESALEALQAGAYRYFAKPFNNEELALTIRFAAEQGQGRRERKILSALQQVSAAINSTLDINEILRRTCQAVVELFGVQHSGFVLFEPDLSVGKAVAEYPDRETLGIRRALGTIIPVRGVPVEERLVYQKEVLNIPDVDSNIELGPVREIFLDFGIHSILVVPIVVQDQVIASFSLDAIRERRTFSVSEIELCKSLANQVAVALENSRLLKESQQRANQLTALRQTTLAVTSQLDRKTLLATIIQQAVGLSRAGSGGVYEYYPERGELTIVADHGRPKNVRGNILRVGEGMAGRLVQSGAPFMIVDDYNQWEGRAQIYADQRPFGAVVEVPLKWQKRIIGVLYLDDEVGRKFTEEDARLLSLFADHAAIALANADLTAKDRDRLHRLQRLSQISNEIMSNLGSMPLDDRLNLIASYAAEILEAESCGILLVKREGYLSLEASVGHREGGFEKGKELAIRSGPKTGLTGHIAFEGKIFNADRKELDSHFAVKGEPPLAASGQCYSLLAIPLKKSIESEEKLVGLLRADNKKGENEKAGPTIRFNQEDEWILNFFAKAVVVAIESAELVKQLSEQKNHLELLLKASNTVAQAENLTVGLQSLAEMMVSHLRHTFCRILLRDEREPFLLVKAAYPIPRSGEALNWEPRLEQRIALSDWQGLDNLVSRDRHTVLNLSDQRVHDSLIKFSRFLGLDQDIQCLLMIPVKIGDKVVGLLDLGELRIEGRSQFSPEEIDLASAVAAQTATLIDRMLRFEDTQRREHLLDALDGASRHIRAETETEKLLQEVVRLAAELVGCTAGGLYLYHPHLDELELRVTYGLPDELITNGLSRIQSLVGLVARMGQTKRSDECSDWPGQRVTLAPYNLDTAIGVPLKHDGEVEAVLFVADNTGQRQWTKADLEILERFAVQASIALHTSRLMSAEQRVFQRLTILLKISDYIQAAGDLNKILHVVLTGITAGYGLGFNRAALFMLDESRENLIGRIGIGYLEKATAKADWKDHEQRGMENFSRYIEALEHKGLPSTPIGERMHNLQFPIGSATPSIFSQVIDEQEWKIVTEGDLSDLLPSSFIQAFGPALPLVVVPLLAQEQVTGVLVADNKFTESPITKEDVESLLTFANTAALAIRNAQLYGETERRAEALQMLYEAGKAITGNLTLQETLNRIPEQVMRILGGDGWEEGYYSHVALLEGTKLYYASASPPEILSGLRNEMGRVDLTTSPRIGVTGRAATTGEMQYVPDVRTDTDYIEYESRTRSELAVPIKIGDRVVGVINVEHPALNAFSEEDQRGLVLLAAQAAVAIHNAQLFKQLEGLHEAGRAITSSLELNEILNQIVEQAWKLAGQFGAGSSSIGLVENNKARLVASYPKEAFARIRAVVGEEADPRIGIKGRIGVAGRAIRDGKSQLVEDVNADPDYLATDPNTRSELAVPIVFAGQVIGVINVEHPEVNAFDNESQFILESLAAQSAVAIHNAQLYEELKRTKGLVGSRTALAWTGMMSSTWRHAIEKHAITIRDQIELLRRDLAHANLVPDSTEGRLVMIERLTNRILEKPITPPLTAEEGVVLVPLNDLIQERTRKLWVNEPYKRVKLTLELALEPTATTHSSPEWLRRALDILIDNAVEATADQVERQVTISTRRVGNRAEILIADNGKGIPEEILPKLLQEPIGKSKEVKGLGMGLLFAHTIVQTYGGEIRVGSTGPTGTTMIILMPLER